MKKESKKPDFTISEIQKNEPQKEPRHSSEEMVLRQFQEAKRDLERVVQIFDQVGFRDFVNYLASPRTIMWRNFLAGVARGLGIVIGMTIVVTVSLWMLTKLADFPVIGEYARGLFELFGKNPPITPQY